MDKINSLGNIDDKYTLVKKIGSGGTSKVYLAHKISDDKELFAIKIIKPSSNQETKFFMNEITVLKQISHPNVVRLIDGGTGYLTKESNGKKQQIQYLVLELVKYGELFDYIFFPQKGFGEELGKYITIQLLDGLESCHKAGVVHRDMKTENIMLGEDWQMKIADFGFAAKTEGKKGNGLLYTALGTASYASPELLQKKPYLGVQSDIFSLGVSLFVMVTGKMPFKHALTDDPYYKEIVKLNYESYWEKLSNKIPDISKEFKQLFVMLISYDPSSRPTIEETREHKWIKGYKPKMDLINSEFSSRAKLVAYKKDQIRKKEEEDKQIELHNKFTVYKDEGKKEIVETSDFLDIRDFDYNSCNPYVISFNNESHPGKFYDYIINSVSKNSFIDLKRQEGKYKLNIGCKPSEKSSEIVEIGGYRKDFLIDEVEAQLEIKKTNDGVAIELTRVIGNKFDFHNLFSEIEYLISSEKKF